MYKDTDDGDVPFTSSSQMSWTIVRFHFDPPLLQPMRLYRIITGMLFILVDTESSFIFTSAQNSVYFASKYSSLCEILILFYFS